MNNHNSLDPNRISFVAYDAEIHGLISQSLYCKHVEDDYSWSVEMS